MQLSDYEFTVTSVNNVIERPSTHVWRSANTICSHSYVMVFSVDGMATYNIEGRGELSVRKDEVYIFPPNNKRTGMSDEKDPWHFFSINFDIDITNGDIDFFNETLLRNTDVNDKVKELILELYNIWSGKFALYQTRCRTIVQQVICELILHQTKIAKNPCKKKLEGAKRYIQQHFTERLNMQDISAISGLSESHFRKLFTINYGQSPMQYIIYLRINKAKDLLASGEFNVSEVSELSGFSDVFYFSRLFKKKTGIAPSEFIK